MTQLQWLTLFLKIGTVDSFLWIVAWVVDYSRLTHGDAWRHPLGLTLILTKIALAATLVFFILGLFLQLSRLTSETFGWIETVTLAAIGPLMLWRIMVFRRTQHDDE